MELGYVTYLLYFGVLMFTSRNWLYWTINSTIGQLNTKFLFSPPRMLAADLTPKEFGGAAIKAGYIYITGRNNLYRLLLHSVNTDQYITG
jgi:hypothetical protein